MLSLSLILTPCLMITGYVIPLTNAYFDEVSFAATYSDHVPFFFYSPRLMFSLTTSTLKTFN